MLPPAVTRDHLSLARYLVVAYGTLALLAGVAWLLPRMNAATLGTAIVVLAIPSMAGLWHRSAMRRLARIHQFAPERWLGRWSARRVLGQVGGALVAVALSAAVVLQSPFFGISEWALLAVVPLLFLALRHAALTRAGPLYSRDAYAASGASRLAHLLTVSVLLVAWLVVRYVTAADADRPIAELVYELQAGWPQVETATARWAVDAGAWTQATLAMLDGPGSASWWRVLIALFVLPLTVFVYATWSAAGASLEVAAWRRMLGASLTDAEVPPRIALRRLVAYGVASIAATAIGVLVFAQADAALGRQERFLALAALPQCERIGARVYSLGTFAKVQAYDSVLEERMASRRTTACARIAEVGRVAERNVDAYLDWYFSLGGDWTRFALMFAGDVESLLEVKFNKLVAADPRIVSLIGELQLDQHYLLEVASVGRNGLVDLLEQQRLVLDERQCKVVTEAGKGIAALPRYDGLRTRMIASAATGVVAGAIAGRLTARAMQRASMQAAGKVLGRATAKRSLSRLGSAGAGVAAGALAGSVVPGVGTVAGAAAGLAADVAMLAVEEKLTRQDMRRDLLAAIDESLATLRGAFDCPGR